MTPFRAPRHGLGDSQAACVLLETLNTKKLFADGLAIVPWKFGLSASEDTRDKRLQDKRLQANLSASRQGTRVALVSRIRSSLYFAARSGANFGFDKDTSKLMILVSFMVQKFARRTRGEDGANL